jgi:hypothetical protein
MVPAIQGRKRCGQIGLIGGSVIFLVNQKVRGNVDAEPVYDKRSPGTLERGRIWENSLKNNSASEF